MRHTEEQIQDILITACEGGVNYWAHVKKYDPDNTYAVIMDYVDESAKTYTVTARTIRKGLKLASQSEHEHIRFISVIDIPDAIEADIIVQLGLFSEIIYG